MEYGFELALCAHLEEATDWLLGRQLGAAVADPGSRVMDVVGVVPGPGFDARTAITERTIPDAAIASEVGVGEAVFWRDAFECHPERAREAADRAVDVGFFERERRGGRQYVRQVARYPDWIGELVGIENKPDLGTPGDLERQLRHDVALSLFDRVVLATESYVTGAHLNRVPDPVGIWRFDPETGDREVVREPTPLPADRGGVEPLEDHPLRTDVALVSAEAKARKRRQVAERAYGKGWRPDDLPGCAHATVTDDGRPYCARFDRVVDPATDCGDGCRAHDPADPPTVDLDALRDERSPWVRDPDGLASEQAGLDRFGRRQD